MHEREDAWLQSPQSRYLRPDFERYLRPDRERYLKPQVQDDPPRHVRYAPATIAREIEDVREQRAMLAGILREKQELAALKVKLAFLRSVRLLFKARSPSDFDPRRSHYDPQPRVPKGNPDGGQWTDAGGGREGWVQVAGPYQGGRGGRSRGGLSADRPAAEAYRQGRLAEIRRDYENELRALRNERPEYQSWEPRTSVYSGPGGRTIEDDIFIARTNLQKVQTMRSEMSRHQISGSSQLSPTSAPSRDLTPRSLMDIYRESGHLSDHLGRPVSWPYTRNTITASEVNGTVVFGTNSRAPPYTNHDMATARETRSRMIESFPTVLDTVHAGRMPNNSLFHAESTALLRLQSFTGGSLAGREFDVHVSRRVCGHCREVLPSLGLEVGNPRVNFIELTTGRASTMQNGTWLRWREK